MTWVAIKRSIRKFLAWCKANWKLLLGVSVGIGIMVLLKGDAPNLMNLYREILEKRQKEYDAIDKEHTDAIRRQQEAAERALEAMRQVEAKYAEREEELEAKKRKEIEKTIEKAACDPDELARELARLTGVTYIPGSKQ